MKKIVCVFLSLVLLCAVCVMPALAGNGTEEISFVSTKGKVASSSDTDVAANVYFIPIQISVSRNSTVVDGYFVNLNPNRTVEDFEDFEMEVYCEGELLMSGDFGTINRFTIEPLGVVYQSFDFGRVSGLSQGTYSCSNTDGCYAEIYLSVYYS